jgi:hypothetical protein
MKRFLISLISALLAVILLAGALPVCAADVSADGLANDILLSQMEKDGFSDTQAWLDSLAENVGDGREWYVFALASQGKTLDYSAYAKALAAYLSEKNVANAVTRQKYAMVLLSCGYTSDFVEATRNDSVGKLGVMSYIFGLHLATNGFAPDGMTADDIIDALLSLRRADGGFSVTGEISDVDVTAMALQALAPYRARADVSLVIREALTLLSERQQENGGFSSYGVENAESAAQVTIALCALGIDPLTDEKFIKNGSSPVDALLRFQTKDGGFSHILGENANANATMQAFFAMTVLDSFQKGGNSPYILENTDSLTYLEAPQKAEVPTEEKISYRLPVILIILALALIVCAALFLCKKRNPKTFLAVGIVALIAVLIVLFTDFQSADSYYSGDSKTKKNPIGEVTLSIRCDVLVGKTDSEYVPENGIILDTATFEIESGNTVYDILAEATRTHRIHMETSGSDELAYVEGIAYLYELQFGDLSGWVFSVNGKSSSVGCGSYVLTDGDAIEWHYTLNLGKDIS